MPHHGATWGGMTFNPSNDRDWITMPIGGFGTGYAALGAWFQLDILIVRVGNQRVYRIYLDGVRQSLSIDAGNPTTLAPRNFNVVGGNLIEFLNPEEFLYEPATRRTPLFTRGDYLFVRTTNSPTAEAIFRPSVENITVNAAEGFAATMEGASWRTWAGGEATSTGGGAAAGMPTVTAMGRARNLGFRMPVARAPEAAENLTLTISVGGVVHVIPASNRVAVTGGGGGGNVDFMFTIPADFITGPITFVSLNGMLPPAS